MADGTRVFWAAWSIVLDVVNVVNVVTVKERCILGCTALRLVLVYVRVGLGCPGSNLLPDDFYDFNLD